MNFFNLVGEPFNITPDPAFLFLSPSHKEALGSIIYGIEMRKGFVSISGEVGTGKTTIIRACLERMNRDKMKLAYIFNPNISFKELLEDVFQELGIRPKHTDVHGMVKQLHKFLIVEYRAGRNVILIVDEAQNMPVETLENLRILSNLETTTNKLLQIVLVGQPELEQKLHSNALRQLRQRIAVRTAMRCLSHRESLEYIFYRLSLVSPEGNEVFSKRALKQLILESGGVPRVINILCDNALIAAYGYQQRPVSLRIVNEVLADYFSRSPVRIEKYERSPSEVARKEPTGTHEILTG